MHRENCILHIVKSIIRHTQSQHVANTTKTSGPVFFFFFCWIEIILVYMATFDGPIIQACPIILARLQSACGGCCEFVFCH